MDNQDLSVSYFLFIFQITTADELDSYMYQTVGHNAIDLYAQAMDLPLYRGTIQGSSVDQGKVYTENQQDEVEDLYKLLNNIKVHTCTVHASII